MGLGGLFGGGKKEKAAPPPPPPAPDPVAIEEDEKKKTQKKLANRTQTNFTSPLGAQESASVLKQTLGG